MFGVDQHFEDRTRRPARVLVIGANDPTGARGLSADLRVLAATAVHGSAVATALIGALPKGARVPWLPIPDAHVLAQLELALMGPIDGCKTAVVGDENVFQAVSDTLRDATVRPVVDVNVLDRADRILLSSRALDALRAFLIPQAEVVVVNSDELEHITSRRAYDLPSMREGAKWVFDLGPKVVLVTGGRIDDHAIDIAYDGSNFIEFGHDRMVRNGLRATGSTLSTAIAAYRARGAEVMDAIAAAKDLVTRAIDDAILCPWGALVEPLAPLWRASELRVRTIALDQESQDKKDE